MIKEIKFEERLVSVGEEVLVAGAGDMVPVTVHVEMPVVVGRIADVEIQQNMMPDSLKWATVSSVIGMAVAERTVMVPSGVWLRVISHVTPEKCFVLLPGEESKPKTKKKTISK
jgi:hypothetical protein